MTKLLPCPSCARHVRRTESACPFCSAAISLAGVPERRLPTERLGRAATLAFGVATSLSACTTPAPVPATDTGTRDAGTAVSDTGTGSVDANAPDTATTAADANIDTGTPVAAYGGPMFDSGTTGQDMGIDTGASIALYGAPGT